MQFVNEEREHTRDVADMGPGHYVTTRWNQTCAILDHEEITHYTARANDIALIGKQVEKAIRSTFNQYKDQVKEQAQLEYSQVPKSIFFNCSSEYYVNLCCNEFECYVRRHLQSLDMQDIFEQLADKLNIPYYVPKVSRKMDLEDVDYLDRRFNVLSNVYDNIENIFENIYQTFKPTKPSDIKKSNIAWGSAMMFMFGMLGAIILDAMSII